MPSWSAPDRLVVAARRAAELGTTTTMVTCDEFGGTAGEQRADAGPDARAARLIREAGQLGCDGIDMSKPVLDFRRPPDSVNEVTHEVRTMSVRRDDLTGLGLTVHERAGTAASSIPTRSRHTVTA